MKRSSGPASRWRSNTASTNLGIDQISSDWRDLLSALATEGVRFLMIGGYAVMKYKEPYHTKDLDLWVDPSPGNAASLRGGISQG